MTAKKKGIVCDLCPHHCQLQEGQRGFCFARAARGGKIVPLYYGRLCSLAIDPIEKKPLYHFYPGSYILSAGSLGCNMNCAFCQNADIARPKNLQLTERYTAQYSVEKLVDIASQTMEQGNIGIAFTYNEPLVNFEYVRDSFLLARKHDLKTVLVTNGQINEPWLEELLPLVDAWNIDLKSFSEEGYLRLAGRLQTTLNTISRASAVSHVEVTTLVVPGLNDNEEEMRREAAWLAAIDPALPLHLSRFFPHRDMKEAAPTPLAMLQKLKLAAEEHLDNVYLGNI